MAQKTNSMTLDINVVSARGLEVDSTSKTKLYVVVSVAGVTQNEQKAQTHVDKDGGRNPTWKFPVKFTVDLDGLKPDLKTCLVFALKCEDGKVDEDLGEVQVSVAELLQSAGNGNSMQYIAISYPVRKPSGQTAGVLNFEYKFGGSPTSDTPAAGFANRSVGGYPPQGCYYPPPPPAAPGYGGYPPSPHPYSSYLPPSPSHYMLPPPYPPYHAGPLAAVPYAYPYPPHPSHVQPRAPPVAQRSASKKKSGWGSALGVVGALAFGALSGGSAPDFSDLTSGIQIPDPSSYAPPDFSNLYALPDPSTFSGSFNVDYSSFI